MLHESTSKTEKSVQVTLLNPDPKFLSGLGKIQIMRIGIMCIGRDWDLPICPV